MVSLFFKKDYHLKSREKLFKNCYLMEFNYQFQVKDDASLWKVSATCRIVDFQLEILLKNDLTAVSF
jgi:hypothetical protein